MTECYACHRQYPDNVKWCDNCKAPILKPKLLGKITCPNCGNIIISPSKKCDYCGTIFDKKNLPAVPIPEYFLWDHDKARFSLLRRIGYPDENTITPQQLIGFVAKEYEKSPQKGRELLQYVTAYLLSKPLENITLSLIEIAQLHLDLENYESAILIAEKLLPLAEKYNEEEHKASLLKILGLGYFELGFYSLAASFLSQAMTLYYHLKRYEEWFKISTYYFMSSMVKKELGEALLILNKELDVILQHFLEPLNEELVPVVFYLFNQLYWSPYEESEETYPSSFLPAIEKISKLLEKIITISKDLRFIHFIDYDRVLGVMIKAGKFKEAETLNNTLLSIAGENYDEKAVLLLKWMGALHFAGLYELEKQTWNQVLSISQKVTEQSILSAIDVFKLRDICEPKDVIVHSSQYLYPEEYTTIITNKPTLFQRQNIIGFEPVETTVGLDLVFPRKEIISLIQKIKQQTSTFNISKSIVKLSNLPARKAIKTGNYAHSARFLENNEIIAILLKTKSNQIIGLQFVSTRPINEKNKKPSHYLLVGYLHKPKLRKRPSDELYQILSTVWSEETFDKVEILTNKERNLSFTPMFQVKKKS